MPDTNNFNQSVKQPFTIPVEINDYLNSLPAYYNSPTSSVLLDLARKINLAGNYTYRGICLPSGGEDVIAAYQSYEGQLALEPGTWITQINGYWSNMDDIRQAPNTGGFKLQIYDQGAKASVFARTFGTGDDLGYLPQLASVGWGPNIPRGSYNLLSPLTILSPGNLVVQVTNMSSVAQTIQVYFACAVPMTTTSTQLNLVGKA
jgi:hypothetical protein